MDKDEIYSVVSVRIDEARRIKLESLMEQTGLSLSQVLRLLIDNAEVVSKPVIKTSAVRWSNEYQVN